MPAGQPSSESLGAMLRAARERAGATVEQISAETRLRATVIRDLENDNHRSSGGSVYARGHVKSIAKALQVDPAPLLEVFDARHGTDAAVPLLDAEPEVPEVLSFGGSAFAGAAAALVPERDGPRWGLAVAAACVVLAAILSIGYATRPSPADQPVAGTLLPSPAPSAASPTAPAVPAAPAQPTAQAPDPGAVAAQPAVPGAQLRIRLVNGRSWVSVSDSTGRTLFEGTLLSGQFRDFSDPTRLKVLIGNARAVSLNCDGQDRGPAGGSGMVAKFSCTPAGLTAA